MSTSTVRVYEKTQTGRGARNKQEGGSRQQQGGEEGCTHGGGRAGPRARKKYEYAVSVSTCKPVTTVELYALGVPYGILYKCIYLVGTPCLAPIGNYTLCPMIE